MIPTDPLRARAALLVLACAAAYGVSACVTYTPVQLAGMQTVDICETVDVQAYNLSPQARSAIDAELKRRNESCDRYRAVVAQRRRDFLDEEMYGKQSP